MTSIPATQAFLTDALAKIGKHEQVLRDNLTSHLRGMFPGGEWWVEEHISLCEHKLNYSVAARAKRGFVDNLVGCTAIEYESNLLTPNIRAHGLEQVREYCAGLLTDQTPKDLVLGVLSDTVRWEVYEVAAFNTSLSQDGKTRVDAKDVSLKCIDTLSIVAADALSAERLAAFLRQYLGRQGSRLLSAEKIDQDLGLQSKFYRANYAAIEDVVAQQLTARPGYAEVLKQLWRRFVGFVSNGKNPVEFDAGSYSAEFYVLTLAKLVLANVLSRKALNSADEELLSILDGEFFKALHIRNLVEYDYFGWLNEKGVADLFLPVARQMQADVSAYHYRSGPAEDLFGRLLLQLPSVQQRILLGQQWTPAWLAEKVVHWTMNQLPAGEPPQLLDMCCGSGTMVIAAIKLAKPAVMTQEALPQARYELLRSVITGFDIDPLAVMLAKASWLLAMRDAIEPLSEVESVFIPIYNADSLMRVTGVSDEIDAAIQRGTVELEFAEQRVTLPAFLITHRFERLFDDLLDRAYPFALSLAASGSTAGEEDVDYLVETAGLSSAAGLTSEEIQAATLFCEQFVAAVRTLQIDRRNGIWAFVLKNSYRPSLVSGKFNGLVSNPPWMALSRLADNPYAVFLEKKAKEFAVIPRQSSSHHTELATVFLLHAVERFLRDGAAFACVLPETTLNGDHQENLRRGKYLTAKRSVALSIEEIWRVDEAAFITNKSIVLCGHRLPGAEPPSGAIQGRVVLASSETTIAFQVITANKRQIWTEKVPLFKPAGAADARFAQGADVFPRRLWLHSLKPAAGNTFMVSRIQTSDPKSYLVADGKKCKAFAVPSKKVPARYFQRLLLSKHLAPFDVALPDQCLLPIKKGESGAWIPLADNEIDRDAGLKSVIRACLTEFRRGFELPPTAGAVLAYINSPRRKLDSQLWQEASFLVVYGAGGSDLCAGIVKNPSSNLIIDQTLYWAAIDSEKEAHYLLGMLNCKHVNEAITPFQASGLLTERHIHKLPFLFIPRFDPASEKHLAVADATEALLADFDMRRAEVARNLDPAVTLAVRRRVIRAFVQSLSAHSAYDIACEAVLEKP